MNAHKVVLTIVDFDDIGAEEIKRVLESARYPNRCVSPHVFDIETVDIGEWTDDHPLNKLKTMKEELERLFPSLSRK